MWSCECFEKNRPDPSFRGNVKDYIELQVYVRGLRELIYSTFGSKHFKTFLSWRAELEPQKILCSPPPPGGARHVQVTGILVVLVETANFGLTNNSLRGRPRLVYLIIPPRGEHVKRRKGLLSFSKQFLPWPEGQNANVLTRLGIA